MAVAFALLNNKEAESGKNLWSSVGVEGAPIKLNYNP